MADKSGSSDIHIRKIVREDFPRVVDLVMACFEDDPLYNALYPTAKDFPRVQRSRQMLKMRERIYSPRMLSTVAVDSATGLIVGYACWELRGNAASADGISSETAQSWSMKWCAAVENFLLGMETKYFDRVIDHIVDRQVMARMRKHPVPPYSGLDDYLFLRGLYVSPDAQRRGIGTKLVKRGVAYAEQGKLPIGLISSQIAEKMYANAGFKIIGYELVVSSNNALMLYEPQSMRGQVLEQGWRVKMQPRFSNPTSDTPTLEEALPVV